MSNCPHEAWDFGALQCPDCGAVKDHVTDAEHAKLAAEAQALREEVAALRARVVDDSSGEFRGWFEGWALETEHPVFGYIGADWLDQGDVPNTYGNEYIQGAWVMAQHLKAAVQINQDERAAFEKHCMSLGWEVRHLKRKADRPDVYDDWSIQPLWLAWQARARLNGKTVSEGLCWVWPHSHRRSSAEPWRAAASMGQTSRKVQNTMG
ncbi:hypothetical protein [Pseudomonas aeruginosa]|uniref:hypothetical protein n=1 Tax=Pseudomonas aeruginosa TaxID=287 RepID=UPI001F3C6711|nr:hypothetical protein [Pseudomonas aeruginosa]